MCLDPVGTTICYAGFVSQPRGGLETGPEAPAQAMADRVLEPRVMRWIPDGQYITVYNLCLIIYIVRTSFGGDSFGVFFCGFPGKFFTRYSARKRLPRMVGMWLYTKRTLPDYLHRPYIFRRGQLSRFVFWVSWEVFHMVLCLIICIVRTSFGGDSYLGSFSHGTLPDYLHRPYIFRRGELTRLFFWVSGKFFTRYSA